jgi:hypothetical protein
MDYILEKIDDYLGFGVLTTDDPAIQVPVVELFDID